MPQLANFGPDCPMALVDKFDGRVVVCAGGRCVWDDLAKLGVRPSLENDGWHVMTVNDIVMHYPGKVLHHYSNDHRWIPKWIAARRESHVRRFGHPQYVHSCRVGARYNWPWPGHGTSALGAVYTCLAMGYQEIVLCGIPLDDSGHYFDPPWVTSNFTREVADTVNGSLAYWAKAKNMHFGGRVRSMSGRTKELLG